MRRALLVLACACHSSAKAPPPEPTDPPPAPKLVVGVDLPVLAGGQGTVAAEAGATVTISAKSVVFDDGSSFPLDRLDAAHVRHPVDGPVGVRVAIDRTMTVHAFDPIFAAVVGRDFQLLVRTPTQTRAVWVERGKAMEKDGVQSLAVVKVGDSVELNGQPATPAQLAAIHADRIAVVPEPTVTMQRLAEVIAMTGGRATLGGAFLPTVQPPRE